MKSIIPYIIGAISGALIIFLLFKGCNGGEEIRKKAEAYKDSAAINQRKVDSLINDTATLANIQDSLIKIHAKTDSGLLSKLDSIRIRENSFHDKYNFATVRIKNLVSSLQNSDSVRLKELIDSLTIEVNSREWSAQGMYDAYNALDSNCREYRQRSTAQFDSAIALNKIWQSKFDSLISIHNSDQQIIAGQNELLIKAAEALKKGDKKTVIAAIAGVILGILGKSAIK